MRRTPPHKCEWHVCEVHSSQFSCTCRGGNWFRPPQRRVEGRYRPQRGSSEALRILRGASRSLCLPRLSRVRLLIHLLLCCRSPVSTQTRQSFCFIVTLRSTYLPYRIELALGVFSFDRLHVSSVTRTELVPPVFPVVLVVVVVTRPTLCLQMYCSFSL